MPFVKYWKPSYKRVVREFIAVYTRLSRWDWSCSSVILMWNLLFKAGTTDPPALKQASFDPVEFNIFINDTLYYFSFLTHFDWIENKFIWTK